MLKRKSKTKVKRKKTGQSTAQKFATSEIVHEVSFGARLREAREQKKLTLSDVEHQTKIRVKHLEALEKDQLELLPPGAAGRGLMKSYCNFLGLDCRPYFLTLASKEPSKRSLAPRIPVMHLSFNVHPRKLTIAVIIILAIVGLAYIFGQIASFIAPPKIILVQPAEGAEINVDTVLVEGSVEPGSELFINGQRVATGVDGKFKERVKLASGSNKLKFVAKSKTGQESTLERVVIGKFPEPTIPPTVTPTPLPPGFVEVELRIEEATTWIMVDVDGTRAYAGMMKPGSKEKFVGKRITINSGKANTIKLKLNGKDWGPVPNTNGIVENLVLTEESVAK